MDNPALHAAKREEQGQKCPRCEYTWDVLGLSEYGAWSPFDENDLICPDCGRNLMEVEKMGELFPERHYYLYAKGYYEEGPGSLEMNLRKIQSHYCSVPVESLSMRDVNIILQKLAYSHIQSEHAFFQFMDRIRMNMHYPDFELTVAQTCLIVLTLAPVTDIPFPLCEANPAVLPLAVQS